VRKNSRRPKRVYKTPRVNTHPFTPLNPRGEKTPKKTQKRPLQGNIGKKICGPADPWEYFQNTKEPRAQKGPLGPKVCPQRKMGFTQIVLTHPILENWGENVRNSSSETGGP